MNQYRCIKRLVLPELYEPEGEETGRDYLVEVGEIWNQEEEWSPMLTKEDGSWLDITERTLEEHFEKLEEN